jgi:glyoxylase-like metal-dependent hydrolase (beta-lactamase superfamily II)
VVRLTRKEVAVEANRILDRRTFITDLGRGAFALTVFSIIGCAPAATATLAPNATSSPGSGGSPTPGTTPAGTEGAGPTATGSPGSGGTPAAGAQRWERVNLGFVSAYILVRGGEAALVDTGVANSADAIETALQGVNLEFDDVAHLILTHHHSDHAGSAAEVLRRSPNAAGYAGAEDIGSINVPRPLKAVADGERVFDLQIVTTPGHTAGSISVLDPATRTLVVGDAMGTSGGRPTLPGEQFTVDMDQAKQSIAKVGALAFDTLLVGHGDPITSGASALVAELGRTG